MLFLLPRYHLRMKKIVGIVTAMLFTHLVNAQITVGSYTGITHLTNITSSCNPAVNVVLGDVDFATNSGVEIAFGTSFTGTWADGLAYSDGPGAEILCVSVHTEEWWDVELLLSDMSFTPAVSAQMVAIEDNINLDFLDCTGFWYYTYFYDRRVVEVDFASFVIPAGLQVIGARFTLTNDFAGVADPIGMLLINGVSDPTISNNGPLCVGDDLMLFADSIAGNTYNWTGPSAFASTLEDPIILNATLANAGTYTCIITNGVNIDTAYTNVIINPNPTATFVLPQLCETASGNFAITGASDTIVNYHWDFGTIAPNDTSNLANPSWGYFSGPGNYVVTLQFTSDEGCTSTIDTIIGVHENPTATLTNNFACIGASQTFDPTITTDTTVTYAWTFPGASPGTSSDSVPTITFPVSGVIPIGLTLTTSAGCSASFSFPFNVSYGFNPTFGVYPICNNRFTFDAISGLSDSTWVIDWDMDDGTLYLDQDTSLFNHVFTAPGVYNVLMVVTGGAGCIDSVTVPVTVDDSVFIIMPNVLVKSSTAGNDKIDFEKLQPGFNWCIEYTYTIFDRWGVKVFETHNDPYNPDLYCVDCFSGKTGMGSALSPGVYYYVMEGNFNILKSGSITIFD